MSMTHLFQTFWRAPTDNDLGNGMQNWAQVWQQAGKELKLEKFEYSKEAYGYNISSEYSSPHFKGKLNLEYRLTKQAVIQVSNRIALDSNQKLPKIPRYGMQFSMPPSFDRISWFGRGPHESYLDRQSSSYLGHFASPIVDQIHHYSRPQENANKTDVRWLSVRDKNQNGILIVGSKPLSVSAWPYAMEEIDFITGKDGEASASGLVPVTSKHGAEVQLGETTTINVDYKQMGVGGDTSWGRLVHEPYTINPEDMSYQFSLILIDDKNTDLAKLARQVRATVKRLDK